MDAMIPAFLRPHIATLTTLLERHLRTDANYLLHGGFWLTVGQVVSIIAGFSLALAFGNLVPKEVFGNYKFVFSLAGLFATISLTAMGSAVTQAVARGYDGALAQGLRTYLWWSIPSVVATGAGAVYYFWNGNIEIGSSLLIVAVCAPLLSGFNLYSSFLQGKKDFRRSTIYGFFLSTVSPLIMVGLILAGARYSVPLFIAVYYFSMVALSIYFHFQTVTIYKPTTRADPETLRYGTHLSFINVLGRIAAYVDKVLVFHFLGAAPLAVYAFAAAPPQYVMRFNGIFKTLALPKLAERDIAALKQTLPRKMALHFLAAAVVAAVYIALAPTFFRLLFPQYLDAVLYSQALGLVILSAPGMWMGQTLIAHMRKWELYVVNIINPLFKMGLFVALIPFFGIWGAIAATLGSNVMGVFLSVWVFRRL